MSRVRFITVAVLGVVFALTPALVFGYIYSTTTDRIDSQEATIHQLERVIDQQGNTLEVHGLPRDGSNGRDGQQGTAGPAGRDGVSIRGEQGEQGPKGDTGPTGTDGTDGTDGSDGTDGANGTDGAPGIQGPTGATGPQGPQGEPGPQGPQGATGQDGAPGSSPLAIQVPDGQGGWCMATDPDGDGVYMCEVTP